MFTNWFSPSSLRLGIMPFIPGIPWIGLPMYLNQEDLGQHMLVSGLTGMGKSRLLAHIAAGLICKGQACSVIDPAGDLVDDVLKLLIARGFFDRSDAMQKLWYIDFAYPGRSIPWNILKQPYEVHQIASNLVEACLRAWPTLTESRAPLFTNILLASATVLAENNLPLTEITRLLTDKAYRDRLLEHVSDHQVVMFFHDRFDQWKGSATTIESTLRRIFLIVFSPALRGSLGQPNNALNFRALLDNQTSVLFNVSNLDEATQRLLGCLITVNLEFAALSRADLQEHQRTRYHAIIDEFPLFAATSEESFSRVLTLTRKYGLFLILSHQVWSQMSSELRGALANAIHIAFQLSHSDAVWAAPYFGSREPMPDEDASMRGAKDEWVRRLENLRPREAYIRLRRIHWWNPFKSPYISVLMHTAHVHPHVAFDDVQRIREQYAKTLLVPWNKSGTGESFLAPPRLDLPSIIHGWAPVKS